MRKFLLSTVALGAMAGSALAADLPSTKAAPAPAYVPPAPVFTWTGFYIGVEGGGDFRRNHDSFLGTGIDQDAGLVGGVLGYNWQTSSFGISNLVLGLEGDAAAVLGGDRAYTYNGTSIYSTRYKSNYAAAIRGRIGVSAWDRALLYVAGGVAFGDNEVRYSGQRYSDAPNYTTSRTGWTIGAGLDYAFTPTWIGRIEYRYVDLGRGGYYNYHDFVNDRIEVTSHQVLGALIYKWGQPFDSAPVVAKY
ncbi:outer membrane immunogenic protein [Rhodoblastus acidophilus]|uniref:outer membrane protein n=1 Tax=Rhodoblastus acidophilus TaxID=1074 RepID=UPI002224EF69|nr:outer membrane beta-barrel protein [Rhodoblastus acidophilus]MCW2316903.1 outer membrane immunogenic protein [Rhodoblastus acidophilus]